MTAPTLVFGWGNPSRGDDALGPLFVEHFTELARRHPEWGPVDCLTDFQLQVEHALDLAGRKRILFVDASVACAGPFDVTPLQPARDASLTTHALSPQALMQVFVDLHGMPPPPCTQLAIRGERFELGESPGVAAMANLDAACRWAATWLRGP